MMPSFLIRSATSPSSSCPIVLTRLDGPRCRPNPHLNYGNSGNRTRDLLVSSQTQRFDLNLIWLFIQRVLATLEYFSLVVWSSWIRGLWQIRWLLISGNTLLLEINNQPPLMYSAACVHVRCQQQLPCFTAHAQHRPFYRSKSQNTCILGCSLFSLISP